MSTNPEDSAPLATPQLPLPSNASLLRALAVALVLALVLLAMVVLPAEYGLDPTGFGEAVGLTQLSATAVVAEETAAGDMGLAPMLPGHRADSVVVEIPAGKGLEYKFRVKMGDQLQYEWTSDSGGIFHDFHGEPAGDTTGFFESYVATTASESKGTFTAPFDGTHGWYWENSGATSARISLRTSGTYELVGLQ